MNKFTIITAAALMTVSGFAIAEPLASATVEAGQQQGQQQQGGFIGGEEGAPGFVNGDYYADGASRSTDGTQRIHYSGEYDLNNVPNVSAPALTTTMTETCMGSTSAGGAVSGFGLSFGTTWRDSACVRRLDARELNSLGYRLGAKELMCDSDAVREALARAGTPCYVDLPVEAKRPEDRVAPVPVATPALGYTSDSNVWHWQNN